MWHLDEELGEHFEWVREQQSSGTDDDDDDDDDGRPAAHQTHRSRLEQNEYASGRGRDS
jgi:hypothetical protein